MPALFALVDHYPNFLGLVIAHRLGGNPVQAPGAMRLLPAGAGRAPEQSQARSNNEHPPVSEEPFLESEIEPEQAGAHKDRQEPKEKELSPGDLFEKVQRGMKSHDGPMVYPQLLKGAECLLKIQQVASKSI